MIKKVRIKMMYTLNITEEKAALVHGNPLIGITHFRFPADLPCLAAALEQIGALPEDTSAADPEPSALVETDRGESRSVDADRLSAILDDLMQALSGESEHVQIQNEPAVGVAGAVAYNPANERRTGMLFGFSGLGSAPETASAQRSVLHSDGTWDCACGTKGLTSKFCFECGSARPEQWSCTQCGTANSGRFCSECGAPRPQ